MIDLTAQLLSSYAGRPRKLGRYNVSDMWAIANGYLTPHEFLNGKSVDLEGAMRMWNGRWKHEQVQELLKEMGWECETKKEHEFNGLVVVGKVDGINPEMVIEIKTSEAVLDKAKKWHEYQAKVYCTMFERDKAIVVQPVVKGDSVYLKEIGEVKRDDEWFLKQLEIITFFHKSLLHFKDNGGGFMEIRHGGKRTLKI